MIFHNSSYLVGVANRPSVVHAQKMENLRVLITDIREITVTNDKEMLLLSNGVTHGAGRQS